MSKNKTKRSGKDLISNEAAATPKSGKAAKAGPKTYSSVPGAEPTTDTEDVLRVSIDCEIERALLDLILARDQMRWRSNDVRVSHRLTNKKLTDLYTSLSLAGFKRSQIEAAMSSTVLYGGDLVDALDWLCLNTNNDELPEGFSAALHSEEVRLRSRPKFSGELQTSGDTISNTATSIQKPDKPSTTSIQTSSSSDSNKQWILQYTALSSDDEEDQVAQQDDNDPNERYLELSALLLDAKSSASEAKKSGDHTGLRTVSNSIKQLVHEMDEIEKHADFNPLIKLDNMDSMKTEGTASNKAAAATAGKATGAVAAEESMEELCGDLGGLFDNPVKSTNTEEGNQKKIIELDRRDFSYTRQQWTGKSPKQFLHDWRAKHMQRSELSYQKLDMGRGLWKSYCRLTRNTKEGDLLVLPDIVCDNIRDAEHLASTLALYHLCRGQSVHQLLPPPYRDIWLEWLDSENKKKKETQQQDNKPRDQFIAKLMNEIKKEKQDQPLTSGGSLCKDVEVESWEQWSSDEDIGGTPTSSKAEKERQRQTHILPVKQLRELYGKNQASDLYKSLLAGRCALPIYKYRDEILGMFHRSSVLIVAGETGSGKSTQVTQYILEDLLSSDSLSTRSIICCEPRRISATSLAQRVCRELGEVGGPGGRGSLCGYQIHLDSRVCSTSRLVYCTTGVLLRQLQDDPLLSSVACVIVDEVHERGADSDFLLVHLQRLLSERTDLRVVLMSATLDSLKFSQYFNHCPVIQVEGRTYPVQVEYIEDIIERVGYVVDEDSRYTRRLDKIIQMERAKIEVSGKHGQSYTVNADYTKENIQTVDFSGLDPARYSLKTRNAVTRLNPERVHLELIVELIRHIDHSEELASMNGAVLIFVPGLSHIRELCAILLADSYIGRGGRHKILALHSVLSADEQAEAFIIPPRGVRKIVISTNVAETGITIPDVCIVIDSGRVKEKRYHETTQMSQLKEMYVSKASADQRKGRAGRVCEGRCFRLYTACQYESMPQYSVPEILRVPLEQLCLHIMKSKLGHPSALLSCALDPPSVANVARAMSILREIGACESLEPALTPLGQHLALLPMDVRLGKMLLYSAILGCLQQAAVIAASMVDKSPFITSIEKRDETYVAKSRLAVENSDHLTFYNAYLGWKEASKKGVAAERTYCEKNLLKRSSLIEIENLSIDFTRTVESLGFSQSLSELLKLSRSKSLNAAFRASSDCTVLSSGVCSLLKASITSGFYPHVARTRYTAPVDPSIGPSQHVCTAHTAQGFCQVYPGSVNRSLAANGWVVYQEKIRYSGNQTYLSEVTQVSPYPLLLFGGDIEVQHKNQLATVDNWITFKAPAKTFVIFKETRRLIDQLLLRKLENPALRIQDEPVLHTLLELIVSEPRQRIKR